MVFILKKGVYWSCKLNIKPETFLRAHNPNYMHGRSVLRARNYDFIHSRINTLTMNLGFVVN